MGGLSLSLMPAQDRPLSLLEEGLHQDHAWAADGVALPYSIGLENFGEGSTWVLDTISFFFFCVERWV